MQGPQVQSLGQEVPLEKGMATHSSILVWRSPWTEEPGGPQSLRLQSDMTEQVTLSLFYYFLVLLDLHDAFGFQREFRFL